jgi:hypothetical protein
MQMSPPRTAANTSIGMSRLAAAEVTLGLDENVAGVLVRVARKSQAVPELKQVRNFHAKIAYKQKFNAIHSPPRSPVKERLKAKADSLKETV